MLTIITRQELYYRNKDSDLTLIAYDFLKCGHIGDVFVLEGVSSVASGRRKYCKIGKNGIRGNWTLN